MERLNHGEIEFLLAGSEDAAAIVAFHNAYYGTSRKTEHWLWEYQTYDPNKSVFVVARNHGDLVATTGAIPIHMEVGPRSALSGKLENVLVLPAYRGSTLMPNLIAYGAPECIKRGMQFIWGFTDAVKAFQRFGGVYYPVVQSMVRPGSTWVDTVSSLRQRTPPWRPIGAVARRTVHFAFRMRSRSIPRIEPDARYEVTRGQPTREADLQDLRQRLMRVLNREAICIRYDGQYLRWRVREHPFIRYDEYQVYRDATLRAYAFVGLHQGVASISDLTSEDDTATALLLSAILTDNAKRVGYFQFVGNRKDPLAEGVFRQLTRFGFYPHSVWNLMLRDFSTGNSKGTKEIFDIRNWHINGLWTEGYSM